MNLADVNGIAPNAFDFSYDPLSLVPDVMLREVCLAAIWTGSDMPHNAAANIRHASSKGKIVGGGIAVNPQHNASWHFNAARALPNDAWEMLDFVWLDLEGPANGISTAEIDQMLDLMGHRIIYTSRGWWESQSQLAGYDPKAWLWDARWPAEGSTISPAFVPYGPWKSESQLVAVQTCGGYQIVPGMAVDDDVFDWGRIMLTDQDRTDIANIVALEIKTQAVGLLSDQVKRDIHDIVKLALIEAGLPPK